MNLVHKIINFDLEKQLVGFFKNHRRDIILFSIIYLVNIFIYGQKLFFHSLATDDYARFNNTSDPQSLMNGRWVAEFLNKTVFNELLHILPYQNLLLGIFSLTLAGYITAKIFFHQQETHRVYFITLLCSVNPYISGNFFFNTNVTGWIFISVGIFGLWLVKQPGWQARIFGLILLALSIATYQATLLIYFTLILFDFWFKVLKADNTGKVKKYITELIYGMVMVGISIGLYFLSNRIYIALVHPDTIAEVSRFKHLAPNVGILDYLERIYKIYAFSPYYNYFERLFNYFLYVAYFTNILFIIATIRKAHSTYSKLELRDTLFKIKLVLSILLLALIPVMFGLTWLVGIELPLRGSYTVGWVLAGILVLGLQSNSLAKNISQLSIGLFLVYSILYINLYYYGTTRQNTQSQIVANQMVSHIRLHPAFNNEEKPILFRVEGEKPFTITGWNDVGQQAFHTPWSKYGLFEHFTDFNFEEMNDADYAEMEEYIINETIRKANLTSKASVSNDPPRIIPYPSDNSLWVKNGKAVIILIPEKINQKIAERLK